MNNFIQLFINDPATAELDMNQEVDIALQYSIADIKDISKRNAAYSKTIILPGTKKNNYWFGNLFDVNADFTMFNPNKKTAAKLLVNTETVIDGFLQLRKITKLNNSDQQGNMVNYEVVVFNNAVDLMSVIGEKTINLLDMSEFGHTFSAANIKESWNNTYVDGYVYPMFGLHSSPNTYKPEYFYPAIFYRTILDQMIREAGFGWTGSLATNDQFNHEVLSYVTDGRPKITDAEQQARSFYVGLSSSQDMTYKLGVFPSYFGSNYVIPFSATGSAPAGTFMTTTGFTFSFGIENGASPQGDGDFFDGSENNWNQSLYYWDVKKTGKYDIAYNLSYYFQIANTTVGYPLAITAGATVSLKFDHILQYRFNNSSPWVNWDVYSYGAEYTNATIPTNGTASKHIIVNRQTEQIDLPQGAEVRLLWKGLKLTNCYWTAPSGIATFTDAYIKHTSISGGNWIRNHVAITELQQNDYIELARYLPDKIKQKDLLTDLIRRYNLYIQVNPENPKQLIFDTRPDFYQRGEVVDWTSKKDYSSPDEIELLSDLQSRLMIWSYKADTDLYNKDYTDVTGDVYGQYKYYFDNDFVKGEERIESSFSPTPLVKTPFNAIVPGINPEQPKVQPRIFYWGGLRDCSGWIWTYTDPVTGATGSTESFTQYPYAGHFDDPINPEIDINFDNNKYYFYNDWSYITSNNMFNIYWSDYVRQIETGRLITSYFYLDEYDIRYIKDNFYTKIFVLDSYYYINKIVDYKPLMNGVTKVELIKVVDGITWEAKKSTKVISVRPTFAASKYDNIVIGGNGNTTGGGVVVGSNNSGGGVSVKGNAISLFNFGIFGDNNVTSGDAQLLVGNSNTVIGDNSVVLAGNNNVVEAANTVLIGASGVTATQSGVVYVGNNFAVNVDTGSVTIGTASTVWTPPAYYTESTLPAAKVQIINDNYKTIETLWRGASGSEYIKSSVTNGTNGNAGIVFIQDSSVSLEAGDGSTSNYSRLLSMPNYMSLLAYDNSTLVNTATFVLENQSGQGYITSNAIGTSRQDIFNLDPSGANGGTYWKQLLTTASDQAYISLNYNEIYKEVFDSSSGTSTIINMASGIIEMTPDSDTTHINIIANGATMRLNIVGLPATASTSGDVWVDSNHFLRIVP